MHAIIVGAGEVGSQLARILSSRKNDVVVVDLNAAILEDLQSRVDVMTITGNGATAKILKQAGVEHTDTVLAVTNNSEANVLVCTLASKFKVGQKIARLRSSDYFDEARGLSQTDLGIDQVVIPEYECALGIMDTLLRPAIKETVTFSHPDAQMANFQIKQGSPMIGVRLNTFPRPDLVDRLRVCAIARYGQLIIPRGDTSFMAFDEVYVGGAQGAIDELIEWADPNTPPVENVIVAGGTRLGRILASMMATADMQVSLIEPDRTVAEESADALGSGALIIQGHSTSLPILQEAGIETCDAFIAAHRDNDSNILSCMLAKRNGAAKAIAVTDNPDYIGIITGMNMIDCGFSPLIAAVNKILQSIPMENRTTTALLNRIEAEALEITVPEKSPLAGKLISDVSCPADVVFVTILRKGDVVPAIGSERFQVGDHVVVMAKRNMVTTVEKLFMPGGIFS